MYHVEGEVNDRGKRMGDCVLCMYCMVSVKYIRAHRCPRLQPCQQIVFFCFEIYLKGGEVETLVLFLEATL